MEYLFNKEAMQKLLDGAPDSNTVVISVNYRHGDAKGIFIAEIKATTRSVDAAAGAAAKTEAEDSIEGCPNPPGC